MRQWIATAPDGSEVLITFWTDDQDVPEVAPRTDHTRWGAPYAVRPAP